MKGENNCFVRQTGNVWLTAALVMLLGMSASLSAQTFTVVHAFSDSPDGNAPSSGLTWDTSGNLYGVTAAGGQLGWGTLYKLDPQGRETVVASFTSSIDGPSSNVSLDASGNFYGTTNNILEDAGTAWKFSSSGQLSLMMIFSPVVSGFSFGDSPAGRQWGGGYPWHSGLIVDANRGLYYGTTGGTFPNNDCGNHCGMLYSVDGFHHLTILHTFTSGQDGAVPMQGMVEDSQGNLYGTTTCGGANGAGTVFEYSAAGSYSVIHSFSGQPAFCTGNGGADGPVGPGSLVLDSAGNLYGTTYEGGSNGLGTVFKLTNSGGTWTETDLHTFQGGSDGEYGWGGLALDDAGNLYGATQGGGNANAGVVFEISSDGTYRVLHSFTDGSDGANPLGAMAVDASGNLHGTTSGGGDPACQCGVVFKISGLKRN